MAKKKRVATENQLAFEEAMEALEGIVRKLEDGGTTLEESLTDYTTAIELLKSCHKQLDQAQKKVELLTGIDADGNPIVQPFDDSPSDVLEKKGQRRRAAAPSESSNADDEADTGLF